MSKNRRKFQKLVLQNNIALEEFLWKHKDKGCTAKKGTPAVSNIDLIFDVDFPINIEYQSNETGEVFKLDWKVVYK